MKVELGGASKGARMANTGAPSRRAVSLAVAAIMFAAARAQAQVAVEKEASGELKATPLTRKPLPDFPGKEVVMITVAYPPGASDPVHRHNARGSIYGLEGSVVMGVKGGRPVTLTAGQTFYEGPNDIHTVGRNASKTEPARFLVFLLKDEDAPVSLPATQ